MSATTREQISVAFFNAISRLNEPSLREACQTLAEIYAWQVQEANVVVPDVAPRRFGGSKIRHIEKTSSPFREE